MANPAGKTTTKALVEVPDETWFNDEKREYVRAVLPTDEAAIYSTRNNSQIPLGKFVLAQWSDATLEESQSISLERIATALERIADAMEAGGANSTLSYMASADALIASLQPGG